MGVKRLVTIVFVAAAGLASDTQTAVGPLSPEQALATFEIEEGYRIEVAAAEPLVQSPVAIAFDERGRLYVVESRGYPGPIDGAVSADGQGTVALLEDTDGDGRYDRRSDFARGLAFPNGVAAWSGGVFVTAAPDVLFLRDTNGDGIAEERRVVLTGFDTTKTPQIRVSHPTLGIDNWVYLTAGLNGGRITSPQHPDRPATTFTNSDSRFNPFTFEFELTGGRSQYGLTFDDFGRRFTCANRNPVWHVVLEPRYLKRNPHLAFSESVQEVSTVGAHATVWPISRDMTTASFMPSLMGAPHSGTFTAASGVHIHRGDAIPEAQRDSVFICESAQNLVQRQVLSTRGVTFSSRPARSGREFLASRDNWFRPVFAANGPDGALYVVDMYRKAIDHPQYVPEASRALLDFEAGRERGRIYRIVATNWRRDGAPVRLDTATAGELVTELEHPNAWRRETAQRLLIERRERSVAASLRGLAANSGRNAGRVHALWTLDGLGALDTTDIARALRDRSGAVRENAVRLAEARLSASPALVSQLLHLASDADPRVRFQVALALGETPEQRATAALASIARRDGTDGWTRAAILSGLKDRVHAFFRAFSAAPLPTGDVRAAVLQDLAQLFGASESRDRCLEFVAQVTHPSESGPWQTAALLGLAGGLRMRDGYPKDRSALMGLLAGDSPEERAAERQVRDVLSRSIDTARDRTESMNARLTAIALLGHLDLSMAGSTLETLLSPQHPTEIQVASVRALAQLPEARALAPLLDPKRWPSFTPEVRDAVLAALMADEPRTLMLLDAIENGAIPGAALPSARRSRLTSHRNAVIQKRAQSLLAPLQSGSRMQTYERLRGTILGRAGRAESGERLFSTYCATCHSFGGTGGTFGPDLSGIRNQPADAILLHVLVPDYEITPGYYAYVVETQDARTLVGRLVSESSNSVTLQEASGQQQVILRSRIAAMTASPASLMPNELERVMSEQDLADVIQYLKSARNSR
jgi:putative membrane-bound dehydrogenase-like protein